MKTLTLLSLGFAKIAAEEDNEAAKPVQGLHREKEDRSRRLRSCQDWDSGMIVLLGNDNKNNL